MEEACGDFACFVGTNVVLLILAKLDLHSLFRARCSCKSWYDLVLSQQFVAIWSQLLEDEEGEAWAVVRERTQTPRSPDEDIPDCYDYNLTKTLHTQLWHLKQQRRKRYLSCHCPFGPYDTSLHPLWAYSSNGLVCAKLTEDTESCTFMVGNPITNQWKTLPPAPSCFQAEFHLAYLPMVFDYDVKICSYNLLFYRCWPWRDSINAVAQYDSQLNIWQIGPGFHYESQPAIDDARVLFKCSLFYAAERGEEVKYSVAAYDAACMAWYHVILPNVANIAASSANDVPTIYRLLGMFKHHKMGLIVPVVYGTSGEKLGLAVWSLIVEHKKWNPLASVSFEHAFGDSWCVDSDTDYKVQLLGGWLIFSSWYKSWTFGSLPPLGCNLKTSTWCSFLESSLYPTPEEDDKKLLLDFECCYAFLPNLAARP